MTVASSLRSSKPSPKKLSSAPRFLRPAIFCAAHIPLAVAMRAYPMIAVAHAAACILYGLYVVSTSRRLQSVAAIVAYIAGCEVLWRMCKADLFWEFSKYAISALLLVGLVRVRPRRNRALALAYLGLLLPSCFLTLSALDLDTARSQLSATMSGPLSIALMVLFFSCLKLELAEIRRAFIALIAPTLGIAALSVIRTVSATNLDFENAGNRIASGGFGPNQVSGILGLAILMLLLLCLDRDVPRKMRVFLVIVAVAVSAQTALTFARGGIALAVAGMCTAGFFVMRSNRRMRASVIVLGISLIGIGAYIEPQLDAITGGKLSARYSNTRSTGRDQLSESEIRMLVENPVLGVGPGMGAYVREDYGGMQGASHTEYTRMLGEHGLLGLLSMACLLTIMYRAVRDARTPQMRAISAALIVWAALFLAIYSTRLSAPAVAIGLACACRSTRTVPGPKSKPELIAA